MVQVIGLDYKKIHARKEHIEAVCKKYPPVDRQTAATPNDDPLEGATAYLRLLMLHDPGGFRHVPADDGALVLSGHTHGGQIGLLSLGINATIVGFSNMPVRGPLSVSSADLSTSRTMACGVMGQTDCTCTEDKAVAQ